MSTATPASPSANSTPSTPQGVRRRDLLVGAIGGVLGASGGLAAGGVVRRKPQLWAGDTVVPEGARVSYAQFGEDLTANSLFFGLKVEKPTYLDIGAFDPTFDNNTYYFYLRGSHGVLVEPNPAHTRRLRDVRPRDTVLVAGIGLDATPEADYYMLDNPGLNTFDKEQAERVSRELGHKIEQVVKMPLRNINHVIAENFGGAAPDYVSIDIEGLDYAVLRTLDFKRFRPKIICAETIVTNTLRHNPDTTRLLTENGYEVRGMTLANTFYVDRRLIPA
jgi:FkbM family methyltransferase